MAESSIRTWKLGVAAFCGVASVATALTLNPLAVTSAEAAGLTTFTDCDALRSSYASTALPQVSAWGWQAPYMYGMEVGRLTGDAATAPVPSSGSPAASAVGNGPTGTNVLEPGVDEPDLAKTDGEIAVTVDGNRLRIYDSLDDAPREIAVVQLDRLATSYDMLLVDDRVVVFGRTPTLGSVVLSDVGGGSPETIPRVDGTYANEQRSIITTIDIADPSAPVVIDENEIGGRIVTAREIDGIVRVVIAHTPQLDLVYPSEVLSEKEALAANRRAVQSMSADEWLPTSTRSGQESPAVSCSDVWHPRGNDRSLSTLLVLTLDPSQPAELGSIAIKAEGDMVHATADRLYVAAGGWQGGAWTAADLTMDTAVARPDQMRTQVHAFATEDNSTRYVASGDVPGSVPGRWAMSGHEGDLRVASQLGDGWAPSETVVTILDEEGSGLIKRGSVGGMGEGEQLKSVRWLGDLAVLVTFRQTDPLYTLDLSEATDPRVLGELKIPGFSTYLHPVGDDVILGAGQDASRLGMTRGAQVSLFDVADLAKPERIATLGLGTGTYSPLDTDPRCFTFLPDLGIAFLSVAGPGEQTRARAITVETDGSLTPLASYRVGSAPASVRALPLGGDRVALVAGGQIVDAISFN